MRSVCVRPSRRPWFFLSYCQRRKARLTPGWRRFRWSCYLGGARFAASARSSVTGSGLEKRTTNGTNKSGFVEAAVAPARRHSRFCQTGRRRPGTTPSAAANKPMSCCGRVATGNDLCLTSQTSRDRQTRLRCDGGLDACCNWQPYWQRGSGRLSAAASRSHPPSLPGIGRRSAVFCR